MVYKISAQNKIENVVYVRIGEDGKVQTLEPEEIKDMVSGSVVTNFYVWSQKPTEDSLQHPEWSGAVPANTFIEIEKEDGKIVVYLENDKVPPHVVNGICCGPDGCGYDWLHITLILILLFALIAGGFYAFYKK